MTSGVCIRMPETFSRDVSFFLCAVFALGQGKEHDQSPRCGGIIGFCLRSPVHRSCIVAINCCYCWLPIPPFLPALLVFYHVLITKEVRSLCSDLCSRSLARYLSEVQIFFLSSIWEMELQALGLSTKKNVRQVTDR